MSFSVNTRTVRDVAIVDLAGRVTVGESVRLLRQSVQHCVEQGTRLFVLNLEGVSYIDSCGLGELVATYTSVCRRAGIVALLKPSGRATELLQMTKLSTVFSIFEVEETAVEALSGRSAARD